MTALAVILLTIGLLTVLIAWDPAKLRRRLRKLRARDETVGKSAYNERLKLTATFLNNIAVGTIAAAVGFPLFKFFNLTFPQISARLGPMSGWEIADRASGVIGASLLALCIHLWARYVLLNMRD